MGTDEQRSSGKCSTSTGAAGVLQELEEQQGQERVDAPLVLGQEETEELEEESGSHRHRHWRSRQTTQRALGTDCPQVEGRRAIYVQGKTLHQISHREIRR